MANNRITFDFDKIISRHGTGSSKWDARGKIFGREDVLPLWVADMDFLRHRLCRLKSLNVRTTLFMLIIPKKIPLYESFIQWVKRRHNWELKKIGFYWPQGE